MNTNEQQNLQTEQEDLQIVHEDTRYLSQQIPEAKDANSFTAVNTVIVATPQNKAGNGLGIASLVLGILAIVGSWVPILNIFSFFLALVALGLGIPGLIIGIKKKRAKGPAIAGLSLSAVTFTIFVVSNVIAVTAVNEAVSDPPSLQTVAAGTMDAGNAAELDTAVASLGTTVATEKFELTVHGSTCTKRIDNSEHLYYEPDAGNEYVVIHVTVKNTATEMESFNNSDFQLFTLDEGVQYSPSSLIVISSTEQFLLIDSLNPGTQVTGNIVFELPEGIDLSTLKLRYNDSWSFSNRSERFFCIV